jgi:hypothetical protein
MEVSLFLLAKFEDLALCKNRKLHNSIRLSNKLAISHFSKYHHHSMTYGVQLYSLPPTLSPSCDLLPSGFDRSRLSSPATRPILPRHWSLPPSPASLLAALAPPSRPAARGGLRRRGKMTVTGIGCGFRRRVRVA